VIRVTGITPARHQSFDEVKEALRQQIAEQQAVEQVYDRSTKLDDALGGGGSLDELPTGLGVAAVTGTLDAHGNTPEGQTAPIPGPPALRDALISAAFATKVGEPPRLVEVPAEAAQGQPAGPSAYYALSVESITPPAGEPFDQVRDRVREDWMSTARHHETETIAAGVLAAVKGGQNLTDAATGFGLAVQRLPPTERQSPPQGVPQQLVQPLFGMKVGEPTMVETADGFLVAVLAEVQIPDAKSDPIGFGQSRVTIERSMGDDIVSSYVNALRVAANPRVNNQVLNSIIQP
jgi:peptidyl-prolyl cis-trans isomerase D